jgi:hypothetical protein
MSVEIRYIDDELVCDHGAVGEVHWNNLNKGIALGVEPVIIVGLCGFDEYTIAKTSRVFGIEMSLDGDLLRIKANNGAWVWRISPAHWWDGPKPDVWVDDGCANHGIALGRWPD